jgi:hypothetical protein
MGTRGDRRPAADNFGAATDGRNSCLELRSLFNDRPSY